MTITLTKAQIKNVNDALVAIKEAKAEIIKAKQAGIPIETQETALLEQESRLLAIKRVYASSKA